MSSSTIVTTNTTVSKLPTWWGHVEYGGTYPRGCPLGVAWCDRARLRVRARLIFTPKDEPFMLLVVVMVAVLLRATPPRIWDELPHVHCSPLPLYAGHMGFPIMLT